MKINDKIISIPPYVSTSWSNVSSLHMSETNLIITLRDSTKIFIPDLSQDIIDQLFAIHASHLEQHSDIKTKSIASSDSLFGTPLKIVFGTLDSLMQALQHNPAHSNLPALPPDIASKVEMLAKMIPEEDIAAMPNPEPNCNCMHCQMQRILKGSIGREIEQPILEHEEEPVSDEELCFEEWDVTHLGDKMYLVANKLDANEHYNVYLGDPIGCTCGKPHCEHIVAVLRH